MRLTVRARLRVDGRVSCNGGDGRAGGSQAGSGGGSGGTVYIHTALLQVSTDNHFNNNTVYVVLVIISA